MDLDHDTLVAFSKSWGLFYLMALAIGVLIYTFWPVDLLPDPILVDDLFVLASAVTYLTKLVNERHHRGLVPGSREEAAVKRALRRR